MKKIKIFVWIAVIFILQLTLMHHLTVFGTKALLVLPFVSVFAVISGSFRNTLIVSLICGTFTGSLLGYDFFVATTFVALMAIIIFSLKEHFVYMPVIVKIFLGTFIFSMIWEVVVFCLIVSEILIYKDILFSHILIVTLYNSVVSILIYPLLKSTVLENESRKKPII